MDTINVLKLALLFFVLFSADDSQLKPVPDKKPCRSKIHHNHQSEIRRVRRSIPEVDAVNPSYFDIESQDHEQVMSPQGYIGQFSLADHVANLFRNHKPAKQAHKSQVRPALHAERALNLAKEEESIESGGLPTDEQEECYKQQNIDPPQQEDSNSADRVQAQNSQSHQNILVQRYQGIQSPLMDEPQGLPPNKVRQSELMDKANSPLERDSEKVQVNSLYSDPEEVLKYKQKKHKNVPIIHESPEYKIYKPVGVEPEFPIYDEDLYFNPDPLQGILDDKYWLDPQERETVIRKYIDLAADNMIPGGEQFEKRSANEKTGFKNIERQCPCKEISACGECSKGKGQKKTNFSDSSGEVVFYSRKLLFTNNDQEFDADSLNREETGVRDYQVEFNIERKNIEGFSDSALLHNDLYVDISDEETQIDESFDQPSYKIGRKLLSYQNDIDEDNDVELEKLFFDGSVNLNGYDQFNLGRQLLWEEYDNENEQSYTEDEYDSENKFSEQLNKAKVRKSIFPDGQKNEANISEIEKPSFVVKTKKYDAKSGSKLSSPLEQASDQGYFYQENLARNSAIKVPSYYQPNKLAISLHKPFKERFKGSLENRTNTHFDYGTDKGLVPEHIDDSSNKPSGYYSSNKLANMIQKAFQEHPKGPPKRLLNASLEYEKVKNETLKNATFEATSEKPSRSPICYKRSNKRHFSANKGRRSYSDISFFKHPTEFRLQSPEDFGSSYKGENKTVNTEQFNFTTVTNSTNTTAAHPSQPGASNMSIVKEGDLAGEGSLDAQVANNIVESVISDAQRSSVFGHNLGICRKNESVIKMKYGKIVPEAEKVLKTVTDCIMDKIREHLAKQSCIILEPELLEFLKWMVLGGESYREYMLKLGSKYYDFLPATSEATTCAPPTSLVCEPEPLPPNPAIVSAIGNGEPEKVIRQ